MLRRAIATLLPIPAALVAVAVAAAAATPRVSAAPDATVPARVPARAAVGPSWISIEYPANPFDRASRGAYLLVHAFHHGTPSTQPVSGVAEGLVGGQRRSVTLAVEPTGRPGVYALRRQWSDDGVWTLVVRVMQDDGREAAATALIELAPGGEVARVQVPTQRHREGDFPRAVTTAEIDASLRTRARTVSMR